MHPKPPPIEILQSTWCFAEVASLCRRCTVPSTTAFLTCAFATDPGLAASSCRCRNDTYEPHGSSWGIRQVFVPPNDDTHAASGRDGRFENLGIGHARFDGGVLRSKPMITTETNRPGRQCFPPPIVEVPHGIRPYPGLRVPSFVLMAFVIPLLHSAAPSTSSVLYWPASHLRILHLELESQLLVLCLTSHQHLDLASKVPALELHEVVLPSRALGVPSTADSFFGMERDIKW